MDPEEKDLPARPGEFWYLVIDTNKLMGHWDRDEGKLYLPFSRKSNALDAVATDISVDVQRKRASEITDMEKKQRPSEPSAMTMETVKSYLRAGQKIQAIKHLRAWSNMSLKEAKDYVDNLAMEL